MSLMKLRKKLASRRTTQTILWALVVVFVAGIALTGQYGGGGRNGDGPAGNANSGQVIATVNGTAVKSGAIETYYAEQLEGLNGSAPDIDQAPGMRQAAFARATQDVLKKKALAELRAGVNYFTLRDYANEYARIQVADLRASVEKDRKAQEEAATTAEAKKKLKAFDVMLSEAYESFLSRTTADGKSPVAKPIDDKKFINAYVNGFLLAKGKNGIHDRFADYIKSQRIGEAYGKRLPVDPFSADFAKTIHTKEVDASMIFIKADYPSPAGMKAAKEKADTLRDELEKDPKSFAKKAESVSKDMMTAMKGGSLGTLQLEQQAALVEYLAFTTKPGEISAVYPMVMQSYMGNMIGYVLVTTAKISDRDEPDARWKQGADLAVLRVRQRYGPEFGAMYVDLQQAEADIQCKTEEMATYL
ncbi:MAG TPA: peptidylprolyl isomerase, partial [Armatimonadota bacterium]|nr:peptidylprolyl isomerase [Armatimonadota bacterium]